MLLGYRALLAAAFAAIFAVSLAYSIHQTATNQAYAYFDTRARLWEFALGSLLALALPYLMPGSILRVVMGWPGLAAMLGCGLILTVDQQFPGYIALWPTLAASAVILAGASGSRVGVDRMLPGSRWLPSAASPMPCTCGTGRCWWCSWSGRASKLRTCSRACGSSPRRCWPG